MNPAAPTTLPAGTQRLPAADLEALLQNGAAAWKALAGRRIFLTGGTGFFGRWLLEAIWHANAFAGLGIRVTVLTRDPAEFHRRAPDLTAVPWLTLSAGDIRTFALPGERFDCVIHAAAPVVARVAPADLREALEEGTRRTLDFAVACGASRFLLTSSGAVYGRQPPDILQVTEDYAGAPVPGEPGSAYGEGKRAAEQLCAACREAHGLDCMIARCFAFVGPHLALDAHFSIGNFIRDALQGRPIRIAGDGTALRSYLYASDLVVWLLAVLTRGEPLRPYNIGSEHALSIAELAGRVRTVLNVTMPIELATTARPGARPQPYVPSVARIQRELGVQQTVDLNTAIRRTAEWNLSRPL